jgi:hypothetical protein
MTGWNQSPQPFSPNGSDVNMGVLLGRIQMANEQQTAILLRISDSLAALPDQIASRLPTPSAPSAPAAPTTTPQFPKMSDLTDLLKAAGWILLLLGVIYKKIALPDAAAIISKMVGG